MSVFTEEEAEREIYSHIPDLHVQTLIYYYNEDIIEEWSDCKSKIDTYLKKRNKGN